MDKAAPVAHRGLGAGRGCAATLELVVVLVRAAHVVVPAVFIHAIDAINAIEFIGFFFFFVAVKALKLEISGQLTVLFVIIIIVVVLIFVFVLVAVEFTLVFVTRAGAKRRRPMAQKIECGSWLTCPFEASEPSL